jgi:pyridoxal phosphate enzyme (YggS family)
MEATVSAEAIAANVAAVRREIAAVCAAHGRDPAGVRLIAVTKSRGPEVLAALVAAGVADIAENRVERLEQMRAAIAAGGHALSLHGIGRLQSRQLPAVAAAADVVHGLDNPGHAQRLDRLCGERGRRLPVFIQVSAAGEEQKAGVAPEALPALVEGVRACAWLELVGLMAMAPEIALAGVDAVRRCFAAVQTLAAAHGLARLSMGMSQDFTHAVAAGATEIRVGTRLFEGA